jgi:hypothetical protein
MKKLKQPGVADLIMCLLDVSNGGLNLGKERTIIFLLPDIDL